MSIQRDILDEPTSVTDENFNTVSYQYDILGRRTQMQAAGQTPVTYAYNTQGTMASLTQGAQTITFVHDALGRLINQNLPGGVVTEREYNALGQLDMACSTKNGVLFDSTTYTHDAAGKITGMNVNGVNKTIGYDLANRITSMVDSTNSY